MKLKRSSSGLASSWTLWRLSWSDFREHLWLYFGLVAVVEVPVNLINLANHSNASVTAYTSLASLFMNVTLVSAIFAIEEIPHAKFKLRQLYYSASGALLRFIIVGVMLALMLAPIALGLGVVALGGGGQTTVPPGELALLSVIGLIFAVPSIYFITRFIFALLVVCEDDSWPFTALKQSWRMTKGRFWPLLGRFIIMAIGLLLLLVLPAVLLVGLYVATKAVFFLALFQIVVNLLVLPFAYLFSFHLYRQLP